MSFAGQNGFTARQALWLIVLLCVAGFAGAFYLQFVERLEPCPLCIFQRVALFATLLGALFGALFGFKPLLLRAGALLALLGGVAGVGVAGRHVWLQHLPPEQVPACGPGLDFMLETMPLNNVLSKVLHGSGECASIDWTLLGMALPAWSLLLFVLLLGLSGWALLRKR